MKKMYLPLPCDHILIGNVILLNLYWQHASQGQVIRFDEYIRYKHRARARCKYWFLRLFNKDYRYKQDLSATIWSLNSYVSKIKSGEITADKTRVFAIIKSNAKKLHDHYHISMQKIISVLYAKVSIE